MDNTKPMAVFSRAGGGHNWHIRLLEDNNDPIHPQHIKRQALCRYEPKSSRRMREKGQWVNTTTERPRIPHICPKCAERANISATLSPDAATIIYGEVVHIHIIEMRREGANI